MKLGAVTHFNQKWSYDILTPAKRIGVDLFRDGLNWDQIETSRGRYAFEGRANVYPDALAEAGIPLTLVFGRPEAHADGGVTPHTDRGRKDFAEFVAAVLDRFPEVGTIEIGNEFNGNNFVTGRVKSDGFDRRDEHYVKLLKAVHDRVADDFPDVEILGGAAHSVSVGYLRDTFERGALDYSDGIAIHPYTSAPEHVGAHLGLLREAMGGRPQPIHATEFGREFERAEDAAPYLVKMVSAMAAAGVESATWYALREQPWFPNMELMGHRGERTPAGEAFALMQEVLGRGAARDVSPDGLTHAHRFGDRAMVIWGAERELTLGKGAVAHSATGERLTGPLRISEDEPVVVLGSRPLKLGSTVKLGEAALVGDSFLQFDVTNERDGSERFEGPWSWHELRGDGRTRELVTMEGAERAGEVWTPYLGGGEHRRPLLVDETDVKPVDFGGGKNPQARYSVLERFTAPEDMTVSIDAEWSVSSRSTDGMDVQIYAEGAKLWGGVVRRDVEIELDGIEVVKGDRIDFVTGVNRSPKGDLAERRIRITREDEPEDRGSGPAPERPAPEVPVSGRPVAEVGTARVKDQATTVELDHRFEAPVVIAMIASGSARDPVEARVLDVGADRFEIVLDEPNHLDGRHAPEIVNYLVVEAGRWDLGGVTIEAGTGSLRSHGGPATAEVEFGGRFGAAPVVLTEMQTKNGGDFVWTRSAEVGRGGFTAFMTEEEAREGSGHLREEFGWVAVERGEGAAGSRRGPVPLEVSDPGQEVTHRWEEFAFDEDLGSAPLVFADMIARDGDPMGLMIDRVGAGGGRMRVQEDWSQDRETNHKDVAVDWLAFGGDGLLHAG